MPSVNCDLLILIFHLQKPKGSNPSRLPTFRLLAVLRYVTLRVFAPNNIGKKYVKYLCHARIAFPFCFN